MNELNQICLPKELSFISRKIPQICRPKQIEDKQASKIERE